MQLNIQMLLQGHKLFNSKVSMVFFLKKKSLIIQVTIISANLLL